MSTTPNDAARREGERRRDEGMELARRARGRLATYAQLKLLEAILRSPDRCATTDDLDDDLLARRESGGKWLGSAVRSLATDGLLRPIGYCLSRRPHRHRGVIRQWQAADTDQASTCNALSY